MSWDDAQRNYNQIYQNPQPHKADWKHETVAGGAAFAAMHEFEKHEENQGQQVDHGFAKELVAGIAGAEVDKLAETHGMDWIDKEKAKHQAKQEAQQLYDQSYGRQPEGGYYNQMPNQFYNGPPQQGGYPMQGGYDQGSYMQGGYPMQGGYDQGGYMQGGPPMQGGYNQGGPPMQGGYNQGGYMQGGPPMQGGYNQGGRW